MVIYERTFMDKVGIGWKVGGMLAHTTHKPLEKPKVKDASLVSTVIDGVPCFLIDIPFVVPGGTYSSTTDLYDFCFFLGRFTIEVPYFRRFLDHVIGKNSHGICLDGYYEYYDRSHKIMIEVDPDIYGYTDLPVNGIFFSPEKLLPDSSCEVSPDDSYADFSSHDSDFQDDRADEEEDEDY